MSKKIDHMEFSRKGGNTTKEKYGNDHYKKIAPIGGSNTVKRYGIEHMAEIGKKGAEKRKQKKQAQNEDAATKLSKLILGEN